MRLCRFVVGGRGGNDIFREARFPRLGLFDLFINVSEGEVSWGPDALFLALHARIIFSVRLTIHIDPALRLALPSMLLRTLVTPYAGVQVRAHALELFPTLRRMQLCCDGYWHRTSSLAESRDRPRKKTIG